MNSARFDFFSQLRNGAFAKGGFELLHRVANSVLSPDVYWRRGGA
jgi:hypothetical protein